LWYATISVKNYVLLFFWERKIDGGFGQHYFCGAVILINIIVVVTWIEISILEFFILLLAWILEVFFG